MPTNTRRSNLCKAFIQSRLLSAFIIMLAAPTTAQAMPWQELQKEIYNMEKGKKIDKVQMAKLVATMDTTMIYTRALTAQGLPALICVPEGTPMQLKDVLSIITGQAKSQKAKPKTPVGELLIRGFAARYPCQTTQ